MAKRKAAKKKPTAKPKTTKKSVASPKTKKSSRSSKAAPKKTASKKSRTSSKVASSGAKIVPLSPSTGKVIRSPKSGQEVFYGIQGPKGGVKKIEAEYAQRFSKKDLEGLNREYQKALGQKFVVYEELTQYAAKDAKGQPIYKKKAGRFVRDAKGRKVPLKKTKITVGKVGVKQRTVLMHGAKRVRTSQGFQSRTRRELVDSHLLQVVEPQLKGELKFKHKMFLTGATIRDTIKNLVLPFSTKQMKKNKWIGISTEIEILVRQGESTILGPETAFAYTENLSDFGIDVAKAIRYKLADHGYRFTSLVTLYDLAEEFPEMANRILYAGSKPKRLVDNLNPIFPEYEGADTMSRTSARAPKVFIRLNIQPY